MKFKDWWDTNKQDILGNNSPPALEALVRDTAYKAWVKGSDEGRQNASKGGKLFKLLRKCFSVKTSKAISNKVASWLF